MTIFPLLEVGRAALNIIAVAETLLEDRILQLRGGDDDLEKQKSFIHKFYRSMPNTSITTGQEISKVVQADIEKYHQTSLIWFRNQREEEERTEWIDGSFLSCLAAATVHLAFSDVSGSV